VQEDGGQWHDVRDEGGVILTFPTAPEAKARLAELYPILVKMELYAGPKRTRVIDIWTDEDDDDLKS